MYKSYSLTDGFEPISHKEIDYLAELALMLPDKPTIVNIGAWIGVSTCTFLEARPDCIIYSIDVNPCRAEFENAIKFGLDASRVIRLLGDSVAVGENFPYQADLIFVDGNHWGAGEDIKVWLDKVRPGGIFCLHDYMEVCPPENPGSVYDDVQASELMTREYLGRVERVIAFRISLKGM